MSVDVRAIRIARGLSLPQLARQAGVPYHVARRAELHLPVREDNAKRLADFLEVEPIELVEPNGPVAA